MKQKAAFLREHKKRIEKNRPMKASDLIKALEEGKTIFKDFKKAYPENYQFSQEGEHVQYYKFYEGTKKLYRWGWGSALGRDSDALLYMIEDPEKYQIEF